MLENLTLFRFAHVARHASAGGSEAYLDGLNRRLLERNNMRILQMYVTTEARTPELTIERVGRGELVWVPSRVTHVRQPPAERPRRWLRRVTRLFAPELVFCHDAVLSALGKFDVRLAVFHWISKDADVVFNRLNSARTPFIIVNHFENDTLRRRRIRKHIGRARCVAGVSSLSVPSFVKDRFVNVSDGIDTDFFQPQVPLSASPQFEHPLIFLPARITEGKGHLDAVAALIALAQDGIRATLALSGRVESDRLASSIRTTADKADLHGRVVITGELNAEAMRRIYDESATVILTSQTEGLGRVLIEAQAMKKPVIAYDVGGVREAVVEGEGGYLVRRGDVAGLTRRLKELLTNTELRSRMGETGRRHVLERFTLDALAERHETLYADAIAIGV